MRDKHDDTAVRGWIVPFSVTITFSLLLSMLVLLTTAWAISGGHWSQDKMPIAAAVSCCLGALLTGIRSISFFRSRALITGLSAGLAYFLLLFLLGSVIYFRWLPASSIVGMLIASLIGGLLSCFLVTKRKKRRTNN